MTMFDTASRIGVLGAGAMGSGIAQVAAMHGHHVVVADANDQALTRARVNIDKAIKREVEKGRMEAGAAGELLSRIRLEHTPNQLTVFGDCALVVEAIVEQLEPKRQAFAALEHVVGESCVLATNTSSLPVAAIASACRRSGHVLGVHFFNPAPVMPLVEIIPWMGTSPEVTAATRALVSGWKKTTVVAADTPGFIVNRVARPYYGEALRILDERIADAATIDWAMREIGGFRMGPFELMDLIGLDVNFAVTKSVFDAFFGDPRYKPSLTQQRLVESGRLGKKTGHGFYRYDEGAEAPAPHMDRGLGEQIFERIFVMLVNEAVDAVHWGVASAEDIDLAVTKGVNYPKGLLRWGHEWGWHRVLTRLIALHDEYGEDRYRPSPLLKRIVREGKPFPSTLV